MQQLYLDAIEVVQPTRGEPKPSTWLSEQCSHCSSLQPRGAAVSDVAVHEVSQVLRRVGSAASKHLCSPSRAQECRLWIIRAMGKQGYTGSHCCNPEGMCPSQAVSKVIEPAGTHKHCAVAVVLLRAPQWDPACGADLRGVYWAAWTAATCFVYAGDPVTDSQQLQGGPDH